MCNLKPGKAAGYNKTGPLILKELLDGLVPIIKASLKDHRDRYFSEGMVSR